jgi:hypothetical protein
VRKQLILLRKQLILLRKQLILFRKQLILLRQLESEHTYLALQGGHVLL